jgi:hypothetical protein
MWSEAAEPDAAAATRRCDELPKLGIDALVAPPEHVQGCVGVLSRRDRERRDEPLESLLAIDVQVENRDEPGCRRQAALLRRVGDAHEVRKRSDLAVDERGDSPQFRNKPHRHRKEDTGVARNTTDQRPVGGLPANDLGFCLATQRCDER